MEIYCTTFKNPKYILIKTKNLLFFATKTLRGLASSSQFTDIFFDKDKMMKDMMMVNHDDGEWTDIHRQFTDICLAVS